LLEGSGVPVENFVVNGQNFYYHNAQNHGSPMTDSVMVYYKFKNAEKAGLAFPPAGHLRVYQRFQGRPALIGEDHIDPHAARMNSHR